MSSDWTSITVGDLVRQGEATIQTGPFGSQLHSHDYVAVGTPVIPTEAIGRGRILDIDVPRVDSSKAAELSKHRLRRGDILFARRGAQATGLSAIVDERYEGALCGTGALLLRTQSPRVDPDYLAMFLSSDSSYRWLRAHAVGAVMPNLNTDIIKALPLLLPSIDEQRELAEFFGALDDRIALLRETNATLEAIAQVLFKSWFGDFDPVRAKQQGLAPSGIDEATAALFPDSFDESALGSVPKGWRVETIENFCDVITNGGTPSRSNGAFWAGGTMPWFKTGDFADGFLLAPAERISEAAITGSSVKVLPANAILMAIYAAPTVGRLGILTEDATFNQACTGMVAKASVGPWFLLLTLFFGRTWFNSRANGAAQQNISKAIVASYQAVTPPGPLLDRFHEIADGVYSRIRANSNEAQTLATLRDTLLPRLISGQLRLPEALP